MAKRNYIPGEEWLYFVIYCGERTADSFLKNSLAPLTLKLTKEKRISKWFFIRYTNPEHHLRIRFHCNSEKDIGPLIKQFNTLIRPFVNAHLFWKVRCDTYAREIERYGQETIENAERLFFYDSQTCLKSLHSYLNEPENFFNTIMCMDNYLKAFNFNLDQKINFAEKNRNAFRKEFELDKQKLKLLAIKYQFLKNKFITWMNDSPLNSGNQQKGFSEISQRLIKEEAIIILENENNMGPTFNLNSFISSVLHMCVNRRFRNKQRLHELLCYEFLFRYYNLKKHS